MASHFTGIIWSSGTIPPALLGTPPPTAVWHCCTTASFPLVGLPRALSPSAVKRLPDQYNNSKARGDLQRNIALCWLCLHLACDDKMAAAQDRGFYRDAVEIDNVDQSRAVWCTAQAAALRFVPRIE